MFNKNLLLQLQEEQQEIERQQKENVYKEFIAALQVPIESRDNHQNDKIIQYTKDIPYFQEILKKKINVEFQTH